MIFRIDSKIICITGDFTVSIREADDELQLLLETTSNTNVLMQLPFKDETAKAVLEIFLSKIAERMAGSTVVDMEEVYTEVSDELSELISEKESRNE